MGDYRNLRVWERAHRLTLEVYEGDEHLPEGRALPADEPAAPGCRIGPGEHRRGCSRNGDAELAGFLTIAKGSASELDYLLLLAHDLGYLRPPQYELFAAEVHGISRMLANFVDRLRHPIVAPHFHTPTAGDQWHRADSR